MFDRLLNLAFRIPSRISCNAIVDIKGLVRLFCGDSYLTSILSFLKPAEIFLVFEFMMIYCHSLCINEFLRGFYSVIASLVKLNFLNCYVIVFFLNFIRWYYFLKKWSGHLLQCFFQDKSFFKLSFGIYYTTSSIVVYGGYFHKRLNLPLLLEFILLGRFSTYPNIIELFIYTCNVKLRAKSFSLRY